MIFIWAPLHVAQSCRRKHEVSITVRYLLQSQCPRVSYRVPNEYGIRSYCCYSSWSRLWGWARHRSACYYVLSLIKPPMELQEPLIEIAEPSFGSRVKMACTRPTFVRPSNVSHSVVAKFRNSLEIFNVNPMIPHQSRYLLRRSVPKHSSRKAVPFLFWQSFRSMCSSRAYDSFHIGELICGRANLISGDSSRLMLVLLEMAVLKREYMPELRSLDEYKMGCPHLTTYCQSRTIPKTLCPEFSVLSRHL